MSPWANWKQETRGIVQNAGTQLTASRLNAPHEITRVESAKGSIISKRLVGSTTQQLAEVNVQPRNIINQAWIDVNWNSVHLNGTLRRKLGWISISAGMFVRGRNEQQVHNTAGLVVTYQALTLNKIPITRNNCWNTFSLRVVLYCCPWFCNEI
jgi:hypothetical protein